MRVTVTTVPERRSLSRQRTTAVETEQDWLALWDSTIRHADDLDQDILCIEIHIEGDHK